MTLPKEFWIRDNKATYGETAEPHYVVFDESGFEGELIHVVEKSAYDEEMQKKVKPLVEALKGLMIRGECFCEVAIGNPNYGGKHTNACDRAKEALKGGEG